MTQFSLASLYEISRRWSQRNSPEALTSDIPIKQLPRTRYDGNNSYNGFSADERKRTEQVMQVLRRKGFLSTKAGCSLCGSTERTQFHAEDYLDPFAATPICGPCHMTLHQRFNKPNRWLERLDRFSDSPFIAEFRVLPMEQVDFATWLRENTDGPHDPVRAVWPDRDIPDYSPKAKPLPQAATSAPKTSMKAETPRGPRPPIGFFQCGLEIGTRLTFRPAPEEDITVHTNRTLLWRGRELSLTALTNSLAKEYGVSNDRNRHWFVGDVSLSDIYDATYGPKAASAEGDISDA
ncbi:hypothetical protein [Roseibium sediminis]|uniref:hypothetical protein n=1 Tax=Roseibium sediminis TaxID=1775174 RepID=UPI00123CD430|nr:hypothetical protein [Roseibium sediminis]